MNERSELIIGKEKIEELNSKNVLIVGVGGVGGIALEMIARSGINNITIIDYDTFENSNLNRQILSLRENIGQSKVVVGKKRVLDINSKCNVNIFNKKLDNDLIEIIDTNYDYILDACDDINAKILLIKFALVNKIKIISSMGMGNKTHPEMLEITNIWKTEYDPLAKALRQRLKKEKISYKLPVVSSKEKPIIKTKSQVGSISTVPNAAGIILASYVINNILKGETNEK